MTLINWSFFLKLRYIHQYFVTYYKSSSGFCQWNEPLYSDRCIGRPAVTVLQQLLCTVVAVWGSQRSLFYSSCCVQWSLYGEASGHCSTAVAVYSGRCMGRPAVTVLQQLLCMGRPAVTVLQQRSFYSSCCVQRSLYREASGHCSTAVVVYSSRCMGPKGRVVLVSLSLRSPVVARPCSRPSERGTGLVIAMLSVHTVAT